MSALRSHYRFAGWLFTAILLSSGFTAAQTDIQGLPVTDTSPSAERLYQESASELELFCQQSRALRKVVQLVRPAVVHIEARKAEVTDGVNTRMYDEAGAGVLVEYKHKSYILTNRHVVQDAPLEDIKLKLADGRQMNPSGFLADQATDVAVLMVDIDPLTAARLGDSRTVEIGDFVLAMGSPFGLCHSVTHGIVSAKGRRDLELGTDHVRIQDFLQTDAAINPGNSGGPLVNMKGEVVGINTAIASNSGGNEGIGFSIPINLAWQVMQDLVEEGSVQRGYLGVRLDKFFELSQAKELGLPWLLGTRVSQVTADAPADRCGIQEGDVIVRYNGITVEDDSHLVSLVGTTPVGTEATLDVFRDGETTRVKVPIVPKEQLQPVLSARDRDLE